MPRGFFVAPRSVRGRSSQVQGASVSLGERGPGPEPGTGRPWEQVASVTGGASWWRPALRGAPQACPLVAPRIVRASPGRPPGGAAHGLGPLLGRSRGLRRRGVSWAPDHRHAGARGAGRSVTAAASWWRRALCGAAPHSSRALRVASRSLRDPGPASLCGPYGRLRGQARGPAPWARGATRRRSSGGRALEPQRPCRLPPTPRPDTSHTQCRLHRRPALCEVRAGCVKSVGRCVPRPASRQRGHMPAGWLCRRDMPVRPPCWRSETGPAHSSRAGS